MLCLQFPHEPAFSADNFGDCPLLFVEKALQVSDRRDIELANLHATPIGYLGQYYAASKGSKEAKPAWFNPYGELLFEREAKGKIPGEVAQTFLSLCQSKRVPAWVLDIVDIRIMRAAAR